MDRIEKCEKKFAELFGGTPAKDGNDVEIMQILQRFIFGQLSYTGTLDDKMRELITCVVLATYQTLPQLKAHAKASLNAGNSPLELREAIYNCMPFIGCPKTLNAVATIDAMFAENNISLPLESAVTIKNEERFEKGQEIQMSLYGDEIKDKMSELPGEFAEAFPQFLTEYCFGDFYTRKGLSVKTREILNFVILMALGGCEIQLKAHAQGCLKAGNSVEDVYTAIIHAMAYTGIPRAFNAIYAVKDVLK